MLTGSTRRLRRILPSAAPAHTARLLAPSGRFMTVAGIAVGAAIAGLLGGPVASVVAVAYLGTAAYLTRRTRRDAAAQRRFGAALDTLADSAAALRAGLITTDLSLVDDDGLRAQAWSALSLSERTGAPLAELLERIEAQHRLAIRSAARAGSEAAGAATTAVLLAALPVGGVALGYVLGVDPARILLHTPLGAGCAIGAILLQLGGLAWVIRLVRPPRSAPGSGSGGRASRGTASHRTPSRGAASGTAPRGEALGGRTPRGEALSGRAPRGEALGGLGSRGEALGDTAPRGATLSGLGSRGAALLGKALGGRRPKASGPAGAMSGPPRPRLPRAASAPAGIAGDADRLGVSGALIRSVLISVGAGGLLALCVGGIPGIAVGLVGGGGLLALMLRAEPPERRREREAARRDLPLAIDLIAAALRAGAPLDHCLLAVAGSLKGAIGDRLDRAGRSLALGAPVRDALRHLADLDGAARVVTAAERSSANGAALAGVLQRCAADLRDTDALAVETASRRAGVLIVLPLGLCFLPAFVLAGLVPVLIAYLGDLTL